MITVGLRLTHDGGIALIHDDRLAFAVEFPKLAADPHGADPLDVDLVPRLLADQGYDIEDVDEWVLDGCDGARNGRVRARHGQNPVDLPVAAPGTPYRTGNIELGGKTKSYASHPHAGGQVAAAYCTSPFAARREPSLLLVWDRDSPPRVSRVDAHGRIDPGGALPPASRRTAAGAVRDLRVAARADGPVNLCFTGDRALDPGWNSALRAHPMIRELWVPPFPDTSGAAIGAAAVHIGHRSGLRRLDWSVRSGPDLTRHPHPPGGWSVSPCRPEELARLLHRTGRPALVLKGRAAVGPRPLGTRSILAPAVDPAVRGAVNRARQRAEHDPIGVVCLARYAPDVFDPGTPDPYELFEHRLRPGWRDRLPAVAHADGTARVQTVDAGDDATLTTILREYHKWSGVPLLCSAGARPGARGFFPDAASALRWGRIDLVWSDGVLHRRIHDSAGDLAGRRAR